MKKIISMLAMVSSIALFAEPADFYYVEKIDKVNNDTVVYIKSDKVNNPMSANITKCDPDFDVKTKTDKEVIRKTMDCYYMEN